MVEILQSRYLKKDYVLLTNAPRPKKNVKYSICSCGLSKKIPYCDNAHREFNLENSTQYKSIKIFA